MHDNDFSRPRRMSKSAFAIFFMKSLRWYANLFILLVGINVWKGTKTDAFIPLFFRLLLVLGGCLVMAFVMAFVRYYFNTCHVENGHLVFTFGWLKRETINIPLHRIHSLRTHRGLFYRLLDVRGVSFDTLASQDAEVELILDENDWNALLCLVEKQEQQSAATVSDITGETGSGLPVAETTGSLAAQSLFTDVVYDNRSLVKGALCQNHLKGVVVLLGVLLALYSKISSVDEEAMDSLIEYIGSHTELLAHLTHHFLPTFIILYLFVVVLWVGRVFLRFGNMRIRVNSQQLYFESGLLSRRSNRFSRDKVSTVCLKQNVAEKWLHCHTLSLVQAYNAIDKDNRAELKLYGLSRVENLLNWWLGNHNDAARPIVESRSGYGMLGHVLKWHLLFSLVVGGVLCYFKYYDWLLIPVGYLLVMLIGGIAGTHRSRIVLKEGYVEIHAGLFAHVCSYFKYCDVEMVRIVKTPLTHRYHRVSLQIATNGSFFSVRSIKEQDAYELYERLLYRVHSVSKCQAD